MQILRLAIVGSLLVAAAACNKPQSKGGDSEESDLPVVSKILDALPGKQEEEPELTPLPVDRVIHDNQGRPLDATVIGRSSMQLTVVRKADKARFDVPIADLSVEDQAWARTLAMQAAPLEETTGIETGVEEVPPYVVNREKRVVELEQKIKRLERELETSDNDILKRTYAKQVKDAKKEIDKLKADIENFMSNYDGPGS